MTARIKGHSNTFFLEILNFKKRFKIRRDTDCSHYRY
jgi:hypothetical protein